MIEIVLSNGKSISCNDGNSAYQFAINNRPNWEFSQFDSNGKPIPSLMATWERKQEKLSKTKK